MNKSPKSQLSQDTKYCSGTGSSRENCTLHSQIQGMEARRCERMVAERFWRPVLAQPPLLPPLDFSSSSEDEVEISVISSASYRSMSSTKLEWLLLTRQCIIMIFDSCILGSVFAAIRIPVQGLTALRMLLRRFLRELVLYLTHNPRFIT